MGLISNLNIRSKLLAVVLPLVLVPILAIGVIVGYVSKQQAYLGIAQSNAADLEHITQFTLDLLQAHYQQFQVYKEDKRQNTDKLLAALVKHAYHHVIFEYNEYLNGQHDLAAAQQQARQSIRDVKIGDSGYLYVINSKGDLIVDVAREGDNIFDTQDDTGRYFIREMCRKAVEEESGEVQFITYPWRNDQLGEKYPRQQRVAYLYFQPWDWIIAASGYPDET